MDDKQAIWFGGWDGLLEVAVVAPVIYLLVIVFVRVSGKRTTGQMNNFDWIVTVAMGSIVASGIVIDTVEVAEAAAAVALLLGLQMLLTHTSRRRAGFDRLVKATPRVLVVRGVIDHDALAAERLTQDEVAEALRLHGILRLDQIEWMLLENTGKFSVMTREAARAGIDGFLTTEGIERSRERSCDEPS